MNWRHDPRGAHHPANDRSRSGPGGGGNRRAGGADGRELRNLDQAAEELALVLLAADRLAADMESDPANDNFPTEHPVCPDCRVKMWLVAIFRGESNAVTGYRFECRVCERTGELEPRRGPGCLNIAPWPIC